MDASRGKMVAKKGGGGVADQEQIQQVAQLLLRKVKCRLEDTQWADLTPQAAKHISSTLKDIRDLQNDAADAPNIIVKIAPELEDLGN